MRLTKLFNKNYLIQNLKKSKALLALILGLIPLINTLIFLLYSSSGTTQVATLQIISIVNYAAVFTLPILLAVALFGYSFKRKQIDFISSMPINRKAVFITNIIGGIAILISIVAINAILILVINSFYPNIIMASSLIWDYFVYWVVSYIFVFMAASVATTIASNTITTFVVTALILFLISFLHDSLFGVTGAFLHGMHSTTSPFIPIKDNFYTTPYRLITMAISPSPGKVPFYCLASIIKMIVISVGYTFIGIYLFTKKKLEVNETSFKNFHVHTIVKCLTMIPLGLVFYDVCTNSIDVLGTLLCIALLLAYYFI
jgi:ABC-type transport system involved in multi-copper enzyme maturation permease subunit